MNLWKNDHLVRAIQIPGSVNDLDTDKDRPKRYHDIITNKNPDYKRRRKIAIINAKDVAHPDDLSHPSASCGIKLTSPTFDSFKSAFYDPESRIRLNHATPPASHAHIRAIRWQGAGFFHNGDIALSPNLNTIIGGRGAGKTSLLESIRYALALPIHDAEERTHIDKLHTHVMRDSQVSLAITTKDESHYTIRRRFGEAPVVLTSGGDKSHLAPLDLIPNITLLGQNEILSIERDDDKKAALIRRFCADSTQSVAKLQELRRMLAKNRQTLLAKQNEADDLSAQLNEESKLREIETGYRELGIAEKLKNAQLLQRENDIVASAAEQLNRIAAWLDDFDGLFDQTHQDKDLATLPNPSDMRQIKALMDDLQTELAVQTATLQKTLDAKNTRYRQLRQSWTNAKDRVEDALNAAIAKLPDMAGKSGKQTAADYRDVIARLNAIDKHKTRRAALDKELRALAQERATLLEEYKATAFDGFTQIKNGVKTLNKKLADTLRIEVRRGANREELKSFLMQLHGIGENKIAWLDKVAEHIDPAHLADTIAKNDKATFMATYGQYGASDATVDRIFAMTDEQRLSMEEIALKDTIVINLNTAARNAPPHYAAMEDLSTGQKCTAILHLMLQDSDAPLIIDQPEDHLDNAFIADSIIGAIRGEKTRRQFIFATHNANIPVFGDAELIAIMHAGDKPSAPPTTTIGAIDDKKIRATAARILEGGEAAFNIRKEKYGF